MSSSNKARGTMSRKLIKTILLAVAILVMTYFKIGGRLYRFHVPPDESLLDRPSVSMVRNDTFATNMAASPGNESATTTALRSSNAKSIDDNLKFYIISVPKTTTDLLKSEADIAAASKYYDKALNEESAEIWLHRGMGQLPQRTLDPKEADVFVLAGYLHLFNGLHGARRNKKNIGKDLTWQSLIPLYQQQIVDPTKPHLLLIPSWNPQVSRNIGIHSLVNMLQKNLGMTSNLWSVGFERNPKWQHLPPSNIVPIPYVVFLPEEVDGQGQVLSRHQQRLEHSIFYVGDARKNAEAWAGCYRSQLVSSIQQQQQPPMPPSIHSSNNNSTRLWNVQLLGKGDRIDQSTYNMLMTTSDWCLILCGDTPTSRTLTSSMIFGCLPLRVGSRLRGLCEDPCHKGFGWTVTGKDHPHLPFSETMDWEAFPEVSEAMLLNNATKPDFLLRLLQSYDSETKKRLREIMSNVRGGWIYGWGDPVTSTHFGDAAQFIWESWVAALQKEKQNR